MARQALAESEPLGEAGAAEGGEEGGLPFTGLALILLAILGLLLLAAGRALRRRAQDAAG
jgi:hypothetical protein